MKPASDKPGAVQSLLTVLWAGQAIRLALYRRDVTTIMRGADMKQWLAATTIVVLLSACSHPNEVVSRSKILDVRQSDGTVRPQEITCQALVEYQGRSRKQGVTIGFAGATASLTNEGAPVLLTTASETVQAADLTEYKQCLAFQDDPETPDQRASYLANALQRQQRRNDAAGAALASIAPQPRTGSAPPSPRLSPARN